MTKILAWLAGRGFRLVIAFVLVVIILSTSETLPKRMASFRAEATNLEAVSDKLTNQQLRFEQEAKLALSEADNQAVSLRRANRAVLNDAEGKLIQKRKAVADRILEGDNLFAKALIGKSDEIIGSFKARYIYLPILDHALSVIKIRHQNLDTALVRRPLITKLNQEVISLGKAEAKLIDMKAKRDDLLKESTAELRYSACRIAQLPFAC